MGITPCRTVWLDGKFVDLSEATVPVTTHALHYGTTAFEGIRAYWNGDNLYVFRLADHIRRLRRSGSFYDMATPYTDDDIVRAITGTCARNGLRESTYIRPIFFVGEWGISLYVRPAAPTRFAVIVFPLDKLFDNGGISVGVVSCRRFSDASTPTQAKMSGNYLNSIYATIEAQKSGYEEAIMLDHAGNVSEAPGANIFLVQDGRLVTPDRASSALDGITRDTVVRLAERLDIPVEFRRVSPGELHTSEELFLTGTAAEVVPITSVGGRAVGRGPGPVTRSIMEAYADVVAGRGGASDGWLTPVYHDA